MHSMIREFIWRLSNLTNKSIREFRELLESILELISYGFTIRVK